MDINKQINRQHKTTRAQSNVKVIHTVKVTNYTCRNTVDDVIQLIKI